MQKFCVWIKNVETKFYSKFTNEEAINLIRPLAVHNQFAASLVDDYDSWHGSVNSMNKLAWMHYLAVQESEKVAAKVSNSDTSIATAWSDIRVVVPGARLLFDRAKDNGLKLPTIFLDMDGSEVKLKLAPSGGKNPNCVYVTVNGEYRGKIDTKGEYHPVGFSAGLVDLLKKLDADPIGVAKHYGKVTNRCCFCRLELSELSSVFNGYGPICAKRYGLPHDPPPDGWSPVAEIKDAISQ